MYERDSYELATSQKCLRIAREIVLNISLCASSFWIFHNKIFHIVALGRNRDAQPVKTQHAAVLTNILHETAGHSGIVFSLGGTESPDRLWKHKYTCVYIILSLINCV